MKTQYAGFWRRLAAAMIDGVVVGILYLTIALVASYAVRNYSDPKAALQMSCLLLGPSIAPARTLMSAMDGMVVTVWPLLLVDGIATTFAQKPLLDWALGYPTDFESSICWAGPPILLNWLYHAIMESSAKQATVGKLLLKIWVTDLNGQRISFWKATARHFSKILSTLISCIGFLMAGWTEKKQAFHDKIAGCLVNNSTALLGRSQAVEYVTSGS